MPIIYDKFNTLYIGGRKGRKFEVSFCPRDEKAPWGLHSRRQNGYYFPELRELLAFAAGRGYIDFHMIGSYQVEIMAALEREMKN